jgi:cell division protein FtsQ
VDGHIPDITDTVRIGRIVTLVNFIERSSDWRNKIVNISIDSTGNLTLIPRKGQEKFLFGQPDNIAEKLERMKLYYTSIIPATDSSRYTTVDLKYSGQIICK